MVPSYLLDTNMVSALITRPRGAVANRVRGVGEDAVCTSLIVAGELRYGAAKKGAARLSQQMEAVLRALTILSLERPVEAEYAAIRCDVERAGTPIGPNDLWIAAHARAQDLVVVTANKREFDRVPGLVIEDWSIP
ncbi:MAG: type II toxin-antitoxin system VapC family toxin [Halorhodospira sp.]